MTTWQILRLIEFMDINLKRKDFAGYQGLGISFDGYWQMGHQTSGCKKIECITTIVNLLNGGERLAGGVKSAESWLDKKLSGWRGKINYLDCNSPLPPQSEAR